ncbi:MAG: ABC-type transport system, permease component [Pseudomonas sp.]|jgi:peptide/nickel transport system permease protein|uniref:ABC transporter permease n=1 Tax=Pseudomonas sp. TaxID=306 RepID=UPI00261BF967|nr:ABC transporter permease [Pseudomonas sp.]MDB6051172.1 ABC-type transport system, permease component [Pseudomonas sp.]
MTVVNKTLLSNVPLAVGVAPRLWRLRPGLLLAGVFLMLLIIAALIPHVLAPGDPLEASARLAFHSPGGGHWLGTDENGRDVYTRLVHGVRPSLLMGVAATTIALVFGVALGLLAGLGPRAVDATIMRLVDVLLAFPDLLLALVIITFWGQGLLNSVVAVGVAGVPRFARMVRAQTLVVRSAPYIEAATTLGIHRGLVIIRHVLPNAIKPILILATIGIGGNITAGAALSFLGFGAPPPSPEWGEMLSSGRNYLANGWWLVAWPGLAVTLTVVSITALGRELLRRSEGKRG